MNEEFKLTLEPEATEPTLELGDTLTAAQEAVAEVEKIETEAEKQRRLEQARIMMEENTLTEAEKQQVEEFSKKIDISNSNLVLNYGSASQKNIARFSDQTLNAIKTKDLGSVGEDLSRLVTELKGFEDETEEKGFKKFFKKPIDKMTLMKTRYASAEKNIDAIIDGLEKHQIVLMKDVALYDQMYALNERYYKELTMYILAGKKRIADYKANELEQAKQKAEKSGTQDDAQEYNDMVNLVSRFEKKIHDLELTRQVSIQMGPQIRLLQNNDTLMIEKITSSINNTIPIWKNQMVLSLGLEHSARATKAQREVTEITNSMLKKNANLLKTSTIETAKEAERSIIDIETLKHTNTKLIESLDEVMKIQTEGAKKRADAELELSKIEAQLRDKLLRLKA